MRITIGLDADAHRLVAREMINYLGAQLASGYSVRVGNITTITSIGSVRLVCSDA